MIRKILLTTISVFVLSHLSFAQPQGGSIKGKVNDETGEGFPFVNVALFQNGNLKFGGTTDFDGVFKISNVTAGSSGASGGVRIIWGPNRSFPSTNTGDV